MKKIYFITGILILVISSCNVSKRQQAEQIIKNFETKNIPDKREIVFNVQAVFNNGKLVLKGETNELSLKNQLLEELKSLSFTDSVVVLPDSSIGEKTFALVTVPVANLRSAPSHSSELVTQAILGTPVKILKNKAGWYYIQTPDNYISWVDAAGIYPVTDNELKQWHEAERILFTNINGTVYEDNNFNIPVSDVTLGCILEKTDESYRWIKIRFPDGRTGFVSPQNWTDFNTFRNQVLPSPPEIVSLAEKLTGRSYLWGGISANAMDCSGFVKTVYFVNGLILARDASLQALHGNEVELANAQPGDLLFFGQQATENSKAKVTHVALSLGGTEYIHASGFIKQNSFDPSSEIYSEYRKNSFIKAIRVINFEDKGIQKIKDHSWY